MNMKNIFYCLLPGLLLGACSNKVYEKTGDSVIVKDNTKKQEVLVWFAFR